jgi:hypothetical protein
LVRELQEECFRRDPCSGADTLTPPDVSRITWSRGEVRTFFESGGSYAPLPDAAPTHASRARLGRGGPAVRAAPSPPLSDGVLTLLETKETSGFAPIAEQLAHHGWALVPFGGSAPGVWSDALAEVARAPLGDPASCGVKRTDREVELRALPGGRAAWPTLHTLAQALTDVGLRLGEALAAHASLRCRLHSYTDARINVFAPGTECYAHVDRDDAADDGGSERRVDASDGRCYTKEEFLSYYRDTLRWESAQPPTGVEDRRKVTAMLFLKDGEWRSADGGEELLLAEAGAASWHKVEPRADSLLLFRSDRVLHRTALARASRVTLTVSFLGFYE